MFGHPERTQPRGARAHGHESDRGRLEAHVLRPSRPKRHGAAQRDEQQPRILRRRVCEGPVGLPQRLHADRRGRAHHLRARRGRERREPVAGLMACDRRHRGRVSRQGCEQGISAVERADARRMLKAQGARAAWGEVRERRVLPHRQTRAPAATRRPDVRGSVRDQPRRRLRRNARGRGGPVSEVRDGRRTQRAEPRPHVRHPVAGSVQAPVLRALRRWRQRQGHPR